MLRTGSSRCSTSTDATRPRTASRRCSTARRRAVRAEHRARSRTAPTPASRRPTTTAPILDEHVWVRVDVDRQGRRADARLLAQRRRSARASSTASTPSTYSRAVGRRILFFDSALAEFHNEGSMRPITVIAPEGSVRQRRRTRRRSAGRPVNVGTQVMEAVMDALSKAHAGAVDGGLGQAPRRLHRSRRDPRTGERYVQTTFDSDGSAGGGLGLRRLRGRVGMCTLGSINRGTVEENEIRLPWQVLKWDFLPDLWAPVAGAAAPGCTGRRSTAGRAGQWRPAAPTATSIEGFGIHGGHPSPVSRTYLRRDGELIRVKPHRMVDVETRRRARQGEQRRRRRRSSLGTRSRGGARGRAQRVRLARGGPRHLLRGARRGDSRHR